MKKQKVVYSIIKNSGWLGGRGYWQELSCEWKRPGSVVKCLGKKSESELLRLQVIERHPDSGKINQALPALEWLTKQVV